MDLEQKQKIWAWCGEEWSLDFQVGQASETFWVVGVEVEWDPKVCNSVPLWKHTFSIYERGCMVCPQIECRKSGEGSV